MLSSMTAFARNAVESVCGSLTWEVRSVNHRFLDISIRMPEIFRYLEPEIRSIIQSQLKRGKVDATLEYRSNTGSLPVFSLNTELVKQLSEMEQHLAAQFSGLKTNLVDILKWPGVLTTHEKNQEETTRAVIENFSKTVSELTDNRLREGALITDCLQTLAASVIKQVNKLQDRLPSVLALEKQRILDRFHELSLEFNRDRLEQEMVWIIQKADIAEELQRLSAHIKEVLCVLQQEKTAGRRLDFFMQELNREANTIASKSFDVEMTQTAVDIKVIIEQMREQVQNVE